MSILVDKNTRLLVQGITGKSGGFHAKSCMDYGTNVVAGVTPGRGGETFESKVPVYDTVMEARAQTGCNATMIFVPPPGAADSILEAIDAGIELVVCITEGIPVIDMMRVKAALQKSSSRLIGPNCPGIVTPGTGDHSHRGCRIGISAARGSTGRRNRKTGDRDQRAGDGKTVAGKTHGNDGLADHSFAPDLHHSTARIP